MEKQLFYLGYKYIVWWRIEYIVKRASKRRRRQILMELISPVVLIGRGEEEEEEEKGGNLIIISSWCSCFTGYQCSGYFLCVYLSIDNRRDLVALDL